MYVFKIGVTRKGWALFKQNSKRPLLEADTQEEALEKAISKLSGQGVLLRVRKPDGAFLDLRL